MCWVSKKLKFKKARRNIRVYKILKPDLTSLFFSYKYIPGIIAKCGALSVEYTKELNFNSSEKLFVVNKAFHSYKSLKIANRFSYDRLIVPFIIPKGSIYAVNKNGEVVSDQIMMEC